MDLSQATDELLSAPWESFVETRARLAEELAGAGKRDDSRALKKLRRPTAAAWATNQVVRREREAVEAYLAASDELRSRQGAMLGGGGERGAFQAATERLRSATASLSQAIRRALDQGAREPDRTQIEGVLANVRTAALNDDQRATLLAGRLLADLTAGEDLASLFGASLAAGAATTPPVSHPSPKEKDPAKSHNDNAIHHADEAKAKREAEARARREEHARLLAAAKAEESAAREAAVNATAAADKARAIHDKAQDHLAELEASLTKAREALEEATTALHSAEREATNSESAAHRATHHRQTLEKASP